MGRWEKGPVVAALSAGRTNAAGIWEKGLVSAAPSAAYRAMAVAYEATASTGRVGVVRGIGNSPVTATACAT